MQCFTFTYDCGCSRNNREVELGNCFLNRQAKLCMNAINEYCKKE